MRNNGMAVALAVLGALAAPAIAQAATYCVDDAEGLQEALHASAFGGSDDVIRLEAGVYDAMFPEGFIYTPLPGSGGGDLDISGGWNNNCVARVAGQRSTIDGELQRPGLTIYASSSVADVVRVRYLQFIRGLASGERQAGGLTVRSGVGFAEIDSNRFADNTSSHPTLGAGGALQVSAAYSLYVRNNVFASNDADTTAADSAGAAALTCSFNVPDVDARFVNNTIVGNTAGPGAATDTGGIRLDGDCLWEIANNILWGNAGIDFELNSADATLRNNDIGERGGSEGPTTDSANVSVDPQFTSATSVRLKRTSPLIDAGLNTPAGGLVTPSFDGGPRLVGPRVDMGAYELDVLFTASFDPGFVPAGGSALE